MKYRLTHPDKPGETEFISPIDAPGWLANGWVRSDLPRQVLPVPELIVAPPLPPPLMPIEPIAPPVEPVPVVTTKTTKQRAVTDGTQVTPS